MAKNAPAGPPPIAITVSPFRKGLPLPDEDEEPTVVIGFSIYIGSIGPYHTRAVPAPAPERAQEILTGPWEILRVASQGGRSPGGNL